MFSRAAKSVVKSFSQRKYHAGEENLKITLIGTTERINQSAFRLAKRSSTLNTIPIYDVAGINKRFLFTQSRAHNFGDVESFYRGNSRMLAMMGKSRPYETTAKGDSTVKKNNAISRLTDRRLDRSEPDTEELVETLHRLPIGEDAATVNRRLASTEIIPAGDTCTSNLTRTMTRILDEMGPVRTDRTRVLQKNNVVSEITEWTLRSRDPFDWGAMYLASLKKEKERKPIKKTTKDRRRVKKVPDLVAGTPVPEMTPCEIWDDRKTKICTNKCFKKNDYAARKWKNEGRLRSTSLENKTKDWTIPSAFTNKKPRLLHDFSKVSDMPRSSWYHSHGGYAEDDDTEQLKRLIAISVKTKPRFYDIVKTDKTCNTDLGRSSDGSTQDKCSASLESKSLPHVVPIDHATLPLEDLKDLCGAFIGDFCVKIEDSKCATPRESFTEDFDSSNDQHERSLSFSEGEEVGNDFCEKWRPVEKVSSVVRSFLTNLRYRNTTEKSRSRVSLDSYHLDDLFSFDTFPRTSTAKKFPAIDDEILKSWQNRNLYASCNDDKKDPCTCLKESQGIQLNKKRDSCKKDPCAKPDPCKKKDPCAKPDPCKKKDPCAKPDPCKKKDPCAKPDPCKKKDPCAKPDPCKKKDPCAKPDPCKKKDPCAKPDPCKKKDPCKPDPCKKKDPCAKPDPCKKKDPCKPDPCKKKDPCAKPDPCKKKDPCAKPDPCKKKDPCAKPDPCKKDPCAKMSPCPTADFRPKSSENCKTEKAEKPPDCPTGEKTADKCKEKQCPPVFRAPGCPEDSRKGDKICKWNAIYHFKDEFLYKKLLKKKYLKFLFPKRAQTIGLANANEFDVRQSETNMELPKLYTLDTFGINFNVEN